MSGSKTLEALNAMLLHSGIAYLERRGRGWRRARATWQLANAAACGFVVAAGVAELAALCDAVPAELHALAEAVAITVTFNIAFVKLVCHYVHREELQLLVHSFVFADEPRAAGAVEGGDGECAGARLARLADESRVSLLRTVSLCLVIFASTAYVTVAFFDIMPYVLGVLYPETYYRELPLAMLFPWDDKVTPNYQITYCIHVYCGLLCVHAYVGLDSLYALLAGHVVRQMKIIGFVMSELEALATEAGAQERAQWERRCGIALASCVRHYVHLTRVCHRLNVIHKPFLLVQALCTSFLMCLCMFMMASAENILNPRNLLYLAYEATAIVQIGIYCGVGQQLMDESERLRSTVAAGRWWLHGRCRRSNLRLFQVALQRPITMYIFGSIELSYATFGAIARSSVSYFTLLLSLTENK